MVEEKLELFLKALLAAQELPLDRITENEQLRSDIKAVVNSDFMRSMLDALYNEQQMQLYRSATQQKQYESLLPHYTSFASAAFEHLNKSAPAQMTAPIDATRILSAKNGLKSDELRTLPEARQFEAAFNSIYSDHALQINTPNDPTRISSFIDYTPYTVNYAYYLSIPTLSQTIDFPIQLATAQDIDITMRDAQLAEKLTSRLRRMQYRRLLARVLLYTSLSPRGAMVLPYVHDAKVKFAVLNDTQFTYAAQNRYGVLADDLSGVSLLYALGSTYQNNVSALFVCPGFEPIYAVGKNKLFQLKTAAEAVNIYLYTIKVLCIRAQVLVQKWSGEGQTDTKLAALKRVTEQIDQKLSLNTAVRLPADADLTILNNNLSDGFAKVSSIIKEYQGMLSGVMGEFYYGADTASYAGNNFNMRITHANIRAEMQEAQIEPVMRFIIDTLLRYDVEFRGYENHAGEYDISFRSLYEPTENEKLQEQKAKIENLIAMADAKELEQIFKREKLLRNEYTLQNLDDDVTNDVQT